MPVTSSLPLLLCVAAVCGLVASDHRGYRPGRYLCKPLAAAAFIWLALDLGALHSTYGRWLMAGLAACAAGDIFLMFEDERSFLAGLLSFLGGHLLYIVAFLQLPLHPIALAIGAAPALLLLCGSLIWLRPHLAGAMQQAVPSYILVITAMVVAASGTAGHPAAMLVISGAWGFALSDLAVARRQFVDTGSHAAVWGTPLYFFAQMLLAGSVALA